MNLVKIGTAYINPEKVVALTYGCDRHNPTEGWTNIFVGGDENDYFLVNMYIDDVAKILSESCIK